MPFCWNGLGIIPPLLSPTTSLLLSPPPRQAPQHTSKTVITVAFVLGKGRVCPRDSKMQDARHSSSRAPKSLLQTRREAMCCYVRPSPPSLFSSLRTRALGVCRYRAREPLDSALYPLLSPCTVPAASLKKLLVKKGLDESPPRRFQCVKLALARRVPLVASNHHLCEVGP